MAGDPSVEPEMPRVLRLLWGHEDAGRRGPKPGLTIGRIAETAVDIADAHGLAGVSMGRVARALGFTTMSLYRYVDTKDDLIVAMLDQAYGVPDLPDPPSPGWRARLDQWARAHQAILLRHPWVLEVPVREPPLGPNMLGWMDLGLQAFAGTLLSEQEKLSSMLLVDVYVRGQTQLARWVGPSRPEESALYAWRLGQLVDDDRYPFISAALGSGSLEDDSDFAVDEFLFGLRTVLDGIESLVERRGAVGGPLPSVDGRR
jgi:AcrR family transcriptional regulator